MKADLYRIFRGKAFYITLLLFLAFILLQVVTGYTESLIPTMQDRNNTPITGATAPFEMMNNSDTTLFFLLSFIVTVAAFDFSAGTVKNVLASGTERAQYYLAKLVLSLIFCFLISFVMVTLSSAMATMIRGFGGEFDTAFIGRVSRAFGAQLIVLFAVTCVGVFFVFVAKNVAATIALFLAFGLLPQLIIAFVASFNENLTFLFNFDLWGNAVRLVNVDLMKASDIVLALLSGTFYIAVSTIGGIMLFEKSEVK